MGKWLQRNLGLLKQQHQIKAKEEAMKVKWNVVRTSSGNPKLCFLVFFIFL